MKKELKLDEVQEILDITHVYPVVQSLLEKHVCFAWESLKEKYTVKKENFIRLHPNYQNEEALANLLNQWTTKAPKQLELLLAYIHLLKKDGVVKQADLLKKSGASSAQLKGLIDKAILLVTKENVERIHLKEKEVLIDVTDSGKGISPALQKEIFTPGFTTKKRGWGLGLTLAKRIVEEYNNGSLMVKRSELGRGSTFRISFMKGLS